MLRKSTKTETENDFNDDDVSFNTKDRKDDEKYDDEDNE
jgi:hypothetical protein